MKLECSEYRKQIPRSLAGDLEDSAQQDLDRHLAACPACGKEQARYEETLSMLQFAGDEPVPRHFFLYPEERPANPWQLFRTMMPRWQAATTALAALLLMLGIAGASGLDVRHQNGVWSLSLGRVPAAPSLDAEALKTEILQLAEEQNRRAASEWVGALRTEIESSRTDLSRQQRTELVRALTDLEQRVDRRIVLAADEAAAGNQKATVNLYQAISQERAQDLNTINTRLDNMEAGNAMKAAQTDAILDTLLQVVNLGFKQPGDQK